MSNLFITIPHVTPALEIDCEDEEVCLYLYNMFHPFVGDVPLEKVYKRLSFYRDNMGNWSVDDGQGFKRRIVNVISFIETFLLRCAYTDKGYLMLHGGAVSVKNKAYAFLADSGVGKSTTVSYLTMRGFEYITDDRILVNVQNLEVIPFTKPITLRPGTAEFLSTQYGTSLAVVPLSGSQRDLFIPEKSCNSTPLLSKVFILQRQDKMSLVSKQLSGGQCVQHLIRYALNLKNCAAFKEFFALSRVDMFLLQYSDLNELLVYLQKATDGFEADYERCDEN